MNERNNILLKSILGTTLIAITLAPLHAENIMNRPYASVQGYVGQINLEGPAVTGTGDEAGDDESGYGIRLEGHKPIGDAGFYGKGALNLSVFADDFQLYHVSIAGGYYLPVGDALSVYGQVGAEYVETEGLSDIAQTAPYNGRGTGEDGDDLGASAEAGINATFAEKWSASLYAKYLNFGDGDGPGFGARFTYDINEDWTGQLSWDGVWVEDAGFNVDLAHQGVHVGLARKF